MRTSMLICLLLSALVHEAQGIRLVKGSLSSKLHKLHEDVLRGLRSVQVFGLEESNYLCKGRRCLESGSNRKLMGTKTATPSTITNSKNSSNYNHGNKKAHDSIPDGQSSLGGKEENLSVDPSPTTKLPENVSHDHSPEVLDLAGMDYSPATRKPPIHN